MVTDSYVRATIRDNTNKEMRIVEYHLSNDSRADITMTVRDFAGKEKSKQRWAFVVEDNALVVEQNGKPLARFPGFNKEKLRPRPPKQTAKSRNGGDETDTSFRLMHHIQAHMYLMDVTLSTLDTIQGLAPMFPTLIYIATSTHKHKIHA